MKNFRYLALTAGMAVSGIFCLHAVESERPASLYERLGGKPAVEAVVNDFVARVLADDRVNRWFAHAASSPETTAAYKAKLADFICQGTGGPCKYTGADMVTAHKGRGITEEAFHAVVSNLIATLEKLKVPEKEKSQLLAILGSMKPAIVSENK